MLLASPFSLVQLLGVRFFFLGLRCCYWLRLLRAGRCDFSRRYGFSAAASGVWRSRCCFSYGLRCGGFHGNLGSGHFSHGHAHFGRYNNGSGRGLAGKCFGFALTATNFPWVVRRAPSAANGRGNDCGCSIDEHRFDYWLSDRSHLCNDHCRCLGFCWGFDAG